MKNESPLDGILASLTAEHSGNVSDQGSVVISGSIYNDSSRYAARNAADLTNTSNYFHSKNEPDQWLCYDFTNRKVRLTIPFIHIRIITIFVHGLLKVHWMAQTDLLLIVVIVMTKWHQHIQLEPSQFLNQTNRDSFDFVTLRGMSGEMIILSCMLLNFSVTWTIN
jgi:hypothetical protein